jgi:succinyl-CoA synthetase beta subunit
MNIHEYQAKALLQTQGLRIPQGFIVHNAEEAQYSVEQVMKASKAARVVVKAQVLAGGRGKAGGIKLVSKNATDILNATQEMLGKTLVTKQTGANGVIIRKVYLEEALDIAQEMYLSMVFDRKHNSLLIIASAQGGTEIEELAESHPDKVLKISVDITWGLRDFHIRKVAFGLGIKEPHLQAELFKVLHGIYTLFITRDAQQIEINPLVLTKGGEMVVLDAKVGFDENALYRHPEIANIRENEEMHVLEREAKEHDLSYIVMEGGNIGCMVNGAGLAMATMDTINLYGGKPANFLDVGGSATADKVSKAFQIICRDANVKAILVNIFGGIMRCDTIAEGIIQAIKQQQIKIPVVVRLEGTRSDIGREIISKSGLALYNVDSTIDDAAVKAVSLVSG